MYVMLELGIRWEGHIPATCGGTGTMTVTHQGDGDKRFILGQNQGWALVFQRKGENKGPGHQTSREGSPGSGQRRLAGLSLATRMLVSSRLSCLSIMPQVSSSPQSCGHSLRPQTADHCHGHRNWSSCACICGTCACGGSGSSLPQSWGHCSLQSL